MRLRNRRGFTVAELGVLLGFVAWLGIVVAVIYVFVHFLAKFW
jgi:Flp pilus assembly pilin Flp